MSGTRPPPNRMILMQYKAKVVGAKKGHKLLKQKRDALKARFQAMLKEIIDCKKAVGVTLNECFFSMAKAKYASPSEISTSVLNAAKTPAITMKLTAENVAGVMLPKFIMSNDPTKLAGLDSLGIGMGGAVLQSCRDTHVLAVELLIKMASLQTAFVTLDHEIRMTSRRVAALEYVVIPRIEEMVAWIKGEMDEMEREEFFRVKKVVEKKKAKMLLQKAEEAKEEAERRAAKGVSPMGVKGPALSAVGGKDPDLLF